MSISTIDLRGGSSEEMSCKPSMVDFSLADLPLDILGLFCEMLDTKPVFSLLMTGDKRLQRRMGQKGVVKRLSINSREEGSKPFPSCLKYLPHLVNLSLRLMTCTVHAIGDLEFEKIPTGVEELFLYSFQISKRLFAHGQPHSGLKPINQVLPNLRRLSLPGDWAEKDNPSLLESLSCLEFLKFASWDVEAPLPPNVTSLTIGRVYGDIEKAAPIPSSLAELCIASQFEISPQPFLSRLPPSLTLLIGAFPDATPTGPSLEPLHEMFPALTRLQTNSNIFSYPFPSIWPTTFTDLTIPLTSPTTWSLIPQSLQKLTFTSSSTEWSDPFQTFPSAVLPKGLLSFILPPCGAICLEEKLSWPPGLHTLIVPSCEFSTSKALSTLPLSLTELSCAYLDGTFMKQLPRGLRTINANCIRLQASFIEFLPPSLTKLVGSCKIPDIVGTFALEYHGESDCITDMIELFDRKPLFPSSIEHLALQGCSYLAASIGSLIKSPIMYVLARQQDATIENTEILSLPSMLTCILFNGAHCLTGACFKDLPRNLEQLDLSSITEAQDTEIWDLPRNIVYLSLSSVIHLTDACAPAFPRFLKRLDIAAAHRMTKNCAEQLPSPLWNPNIWQTVKAKSFKISKGKLEIPRVLRR